MISAKNITFKYFKNSTRTILENFDFTVPKNQITILAGKSGSGKSTLAYILAGLYPENGGILASGEIFIDDNELINIKTLTPGQRVKYVAMMFQNPDLQFCMSNLENELYFCLENIKTPEDLIPEITNDVANAIGIPHLLKRSFFSMSGGEKQKCALCCILALKSKCLILDEAFANIDTQSSKEIISIIKKLNLTVLAIDHNLELWDGYYDNILSIDGSFHQTFNTLPKLSQTGTTILKVENLSVKNIHYPDMQFEKGSITAIVGKSGCGKTTFFKTLIKQNKYKGSINYLGKELKKIRKKQVFSRCGIVFQNPSNQFLALNVFDEIMFSVNRWHKNLDKEAKAEKTLALLKIFGLEKYKKYSPYMLSQGQQRRLAVLSMIAGEQEILLLDEPTYGQDYENICAIMDLLLEKAQAGLTIIFSTHNEHVAEKFSHKVINLKERETHE